MVYWVLRFLSWVLFKVLCRIQAHGRANIPRTGGFILASNHASHLDPIALGVMCPRSLYYMARDSLFRHPLFGWLMVQVHSFPVKRNSADLSAIKEAMRHVRNGDGLVVFPEGTRSTSGIAEKANAGVGFLAEKLGVPVVPAYIRGSGNALPKGAKCVRPKKIHIYFGKQINVERGMPYQQVAELIMANIRTIEKNIPI